MRLLVVEDDRKIADLIVRSLRAERFAVRVAFDGMTGWEMAATTDYDLIILDRMLPGMTGDELLRRLRECRRGAAVLIVTARDSIEDKIKIFEAGADDYLTKPFSLVELVLRVKALLRRPSGDGGYVLRVADLEVDRIGQQAKRAGKRIQLTSKEYALLEYLAAHVGRVLSRTMIVEHVWDDNFDGLTNIVDVYVRHLRSKVDDPFPAKLIHTVRGAGYLLQEMPTEPQGFLLARRNPELDPFSGASSSGAQVSAKSSRRRVAFAPVAAQEEQ